MDPPTVNANPVVLDVSTERHHQRHALEFPELAAISADPIFSDNRFERTFDRTLHPLKRSPADVAVLNALMDASIASNGKGVSLLRNLGLHYPTDESQRYAMQIRNESVWSVPSSSLQVGTKETDENKEAEKGKQPVAAARDAVDAEEIFDIIRNIQDPEHPLTLEQLGVVSLAQIAVQDRPEGPYSTVDVRFTPTIPHCSMATQIGLCLKVKLNRSLPQFKVSVRIEPGTHASENAINKQLADKERVCAALENKHLAAIVNKCIINGMTGEMS